MEMTGSTLGEVLALPPEELLVTRQMIGQYNREQKAEVDSAGGGGGGRP